MTVVQAPRMAADEVHATVEEIRGVVREQGHREPQWWVPDSAEPPDLGERLEMLGILPAEDDPVLAAMGLVREPSAARSVEARPVRTLAEWHSRPILERLGFETLATIRRYRDGAC